MWGKHLEENRAGTHLVHIDVPVPDLIEWDLLGSAVGHQLPTGSIPVIDGAFSGVIFQKPRQFFTTLAISSNCEMCHVAGYTPEARSVEDALHQNNPAGEFSVGGSGLDEAYERICCSGEGPVDFVSLGCPHFDIDQIKHAAYYLRGKHINPNVHFMLWTVYPIKKMADENGYTRIIEEAGGHIYTSSCPGSMGDVFLKKYSGFVFDSLKHAGSVQSMVDAPVYYKDTNRSIDAAVEGRWKEEYRWKRKTL